MESYGLWPFMTGFTKALTTTKKKPLTHCVTEERKVGLTVTLNPMAFLSFKKILICSQEQQTLLGCQDLHLSVTCLKT